MELFDCDRRALRLTKPGCARLWLASQNVTAVWEGRAECRNCVTGAANAGQSAAVIQSVASAVECPCPRCGNPGRRIVGGKLCVSCYNREREALRGRDRKGKIPGLRGRLGPERLVVGGAKGPRLVVEPLATSKVEVMVLEAGRSGAGTSFGRAPVTGWEPAMLAFADSPGLGAVAIGRPHVTWPGLGRQMELVL